MLKSVKTVAVGSLFSVASLLGLATGQANAVTYGWSITSCFGGAVCEGNGTLETDVAIGPATVQSMTGTIGGLSVSLLGLGSLLDNDNTINSLNSPELTGYGIAFATSSNLFNVYYDSFLSHDQLVISNLSKTSFSYNDAVFSLSEVSAVPVPAALPLLASGLAGLGFMGWRRRKAAAVAA